MDFSGIDLERDAVERTGNTGAAAPRPKQPFHYTTQRTTTLEHIADRLPRAIAARLTARGRRVQIVSVRLAGRDGTTVHASPTATADALFLDYRDLAALEAGASVPDLEGQVVAVLAEV